jgi:hypothetical protein
MIYLLTAIGLTPGDSCTVHIYTQTIQNDTKQTIHRTIHRATQIWKSAGRARLCKLYPGICLTTEEKARKTLSQGSRTIRIPGPKNKNT